MFVGRVNEINTIKNKLKTPNEHIIIYGNRRVGKTTLANYAASESGVKFVSFECLKSTLLDNIYAITKLLCDSNIISSNIVFNSFIDLFQYLNSMNERIVLIIDEYPYLYVKNDKENVDSIFQVVLDKHCSNLNVVLSGSHIGMMKTLIKKGNPIFGRVNTIIPLKELNYLEASEFYPHLSNYDKVAFYSVFGGSPYILEQLDYSKSLKENIKNTYLNSTSSISIFVSESYTSDVSTKIAANRIFQVLSNSNQKHNRIEQLLGYEHNGLLSKQLDLLAEMEFIEKNEPINRVGDSKKMSYHLKSNALRFYYSYVYGLNNQLSLLGKDVFYERYIKRSINTFISHRFESIAKDFISIMVKQGKIEDVFNIGSYYYDDSINKKNGEFDLAIQTSKGFDIIEVKYLSNKVNKSIIIEEINQISQINEIKVNDYGFISINGFENDTPSLKYKFDGDDIYFTR